MFTVRIILAYRMRCKYMLGQCCPNANSNASIEDVLREVGLRSEGLRAEGLRAEGLRAEAVKHD